MPASQMAELDWIEGLVCFADRAQLNSTIITGVESTWESLRGNRPFPTRAEIDPVAFRQFLPYLSIIELHDQPLRVRYRLVGTEVARFSGQDFSGLWLHETGWGETHQMLNLMLYRRVFETQRPAFGLSQVDWQGRADYTFQWALFPLGEPGGPVTHCLSADDFKHIAEPSGLLRENSDDPTPTAPGDANAGDSKANDSNKQS
jgi:hypothetical protein